MDFLNRFDEIWAHFWFKNFGTDERRRLWNKLEKLLSNNVQINHALASIRQRSPKRSPTTIAVEHFEKKIADGHSVGAAVQGWATDEEVMLLQAGDSSGSVAASLKLMADLLQAKKAIRRAIIGGIAYPFILLILGITILWLFGTQLIPVFQEVAPGDMWSGHARNMIDVSEFVQNYILYVVFGLLILIAIFFYSLPRWDGTWRVYLDRYPPYSVYKTMVGSSWLIAVATLLRAGMRADQALNQLADQSSPWLQTRIRGCLLHMRSGLTMGDALLKSGYEFPDRDILSDLAVISGYTGFTEALFAIGREWIDDAIIQIEMQMKVLNSVGIIIGCLIAYLVSGLIAMQMQMGEIMKMSM